MTQASMRTFVDKVKRQQRGETPPVAARVRSKPKRSPIPPYEAGVKTADLVLQRFQKELNKIK